MTTQPTPNAPATHPADTPTPRTDAMSLPVSDDCQFPRESVVAAKFARTLEREADRLRADNAQLATALRAYSVDPAKISNTELAMARHAQDQFAAQARELDAQRATITRLRKVLARTLHALEVNTRYAILEARDFLTMEIARGELATPQGGKGGQ